MNILPPPHGTGPVDFSSLLVIPTTKCEPVGGESRSPIMSNGSNASYSDISPESTDTMEEYWFNFISVILGMITIVGSPANLATIVMISRSKQVLSPFLTHYTFF